MFFLQETYSTVEVEERWKLEWDGPMFFSHGSNHSRGVLILISPDLQLKANKVVKDEDGRYIIFKGELQGDKWLLGNCYFPTRDKEKMQLESLEILESYISQMYNPEQFLLLGGDSERLHTRENL